MRIYASWLNWLKPTGDVKFLIDHNAIGVVGQMAPLQFKQNHL